MSNKKKKKKSTSSVPLSVRGWILIALSVSMMTVILVRLYNLQILRGEDYESNFTMSIRKTKVLKATRGEIYDCNGNVLAYNQLTYDVTFQDNGAYESSAAHNLALNGILFNTIRIIESHGDEVYKNFRISLNQDGEYEYNVKGFNLSRFKADIFGYQTIDEMTEEESSISAPDMIAMMCSDRYYGIGSEKVTDKQRAAWNLPETFTAIQILQLCQMRSALAANSYQRYYAITVAKDVSDETVAQLLENTGRLTGVDVTEDYKRIYTNAIYFSPIIGYTGQIAADELKELRKEDPSYDSTDIVGKVGLEKVMETALQGDKGSETLYVDNLGRTISEESRKDPQAGDSLYLTIDADLQKACYEILEEYIAGIVWSNIIDTESINTEWITSADDVKIPVYDVYYSLFENNVLDVSHLSNADASVNEKGVYQAFQQKASAIFAEIKDQLIRDDPTIYLNLSDEMKVYQTYIVDNMLPGTGILNQEAIDKSDLTWKAWNDEGSISLQEFLTYAISKNWVDINGISEESAYMDSTEVYSALADFIASDLTEDTNFSKRVFRYMLMEGSLTGAQVCLLLFDQGVLKMNIDDYNALSSEKIIAFDFIRDKIYNLEITPAQLALNPCSGAIVITDPKDGTVKACVTYPGYDNNRLVNEMDSSYYLKLATNLSSPFYSRATQELLAPGSTFKPIAATAGVTEGVLGINEQLYCTGTFTEVTPEINCWISPGAHGSESLVAAIRDSCNYFFNTVGWRLATQRGDYDDDAGTNILRKYAAMYGLDAKSGLEVPESSPHLLTSDPVRGCIGQSDNAYTVSQLARYVMTIANSGNCYDLTLIDRTTDSNGNTVTRQDKKLHSKVSLPQELWEAIHTGMRQVVVNHSSFSNYSGVPVSGKTGTAQEVKTKPNHALFIGYAPSDQAEIALAVRVAYGYTSVNAATIARDVIHYYFKQKEMSELIPGHAIQVTTDNTRTD